jgi:hypothetical protein
MKITYSLFDGKIKGIAATIIQAVIDGSIDTHYVFTKEFYKEYENACSEDNDMNEDQIYDDIIPDWIYSLDYINEIRALKKDEEVFGAYETRYYIYSGSDIASYVIANILNEYYTNEKVYLDRLKYNSYGEMPHLLTAPIELTGSSGIFEIQIENSVSIEVEFFTHILLNQPGKGYSMTGVPRTNLYRMIERKKNCQYDVDHIEKFRGFIPALLNAIFADMTHRDVFRADFFDKNEVELIGNPSVFLTILAKDIPYSLYTPAQVIVDIYYPQSIVSLSKCLYVTDINFQDDKKYVVEKMLEIELGQTEAFKESLVWNILNEYQQKMIQDYHQYFIQFLQKQLEILNNSEPEPITDIDEQEESRTKIQGHYVLGFESLIVPPDKNTILQELHRRIDGRKGKDIGVVLAAATYKYHVLSRTPSEKEFNSEFPNIQKCSWKSISEWLKKPPTERDIRPDIQAVILNFKAN